MSFYILNRFLYFSYFFYELYSILGQLQSRHIYLFIYIALFTIHIVSKQLFSDNIKVIQHRSIILLNIIMSPTKKAKSKAIVFVL